MLLRSAKLEASDRRPFTIAFAIAAAVGARPRGDRGLPARGGRRAADHARRKREPGARRRRAPRAAAGRGLGRGGGARGRVQPDGGRPRPREGGRAVVPALRQPRAEDAARPRSAATARRSSTACSTVPKAAGSSSQESKRLERLVRDLLDLARLNQRSFAVTPEPVDLAVLAREALARHEAEAGASASRSSRATGRRRRSDRGPRPGPAGALEPDRERAPVDAERRRRHRVGAPGRSSRSPTPGPGSLPRTCRARSIASTSTAATSRTGQSEPGSGWRS